MKLYLTKKFILVSVILSFSLTMACKKDDTSTNQPATEVSNNHEYELIQDIVWASPGGQNLTLDIYTPQTGRTSYPVIVIFHGGGWLINDNSVMDCMSAYLAQHSEYVVCNVNYRLLGDQDNTVTMNQIVEDAMSAVLWIRENIAAYKGNAAKIILTGDSAGGHLASMVVLVGNKLESDGFDGETLGFNPTYLPPGKTAEQVAADKGLEVQAAIPNYAAYDIYAACQGGFEDPGNFWWQWGGASARGLFGNEYNVQDNPEMYKAVSPVYNIPNSIDRILPPQLCTAGSADATVTPAAVKQYVTACETAGQQAEYWEHEGRNHAYLDCGSNEFLGTSFDEDAIPAIDYIIEYLNNIFY